MVLPILGCKNPPPEYQITETISNKIIIKPVPSVIDIPYLPWELSEYQEKIDIHSRLGTTRTKEECKEVAVAKCRWDTSPRELVCWSSYHLEETTTIKCGKDLIVINSINGWSYPIKLANN